MISDEIREFVKRSYADEHMDPRELLALADRIDAEMVELPMDKDGKPIHVGDMLRGCDAVLVDVFTTVVELRFNGRWEIETTFGCITEPRLFVHDSPDSLERIADELVEWCDRVDVDGDACDKPRDLAERIRKLAAKEDEQCH